MRMDTNWPDIKYERCSHIGCDYIVHRDDLCKDHYKESVQTRRETKRNRVPLKRGPRPRDLTGAKYGLLTAVKYSYSDPKRGRIWEWKCDCGNVRFGALSQIQKGHLPSCGCQISKIRSEAALKAMVGKNITHGMSYTPEYSIWAGMKKRCFNPKSNRYHRYGGRGITVCDRWKDSFENFYADMGPRPVGTQLDREDNDGNYELGNCQWVISSEHSRKTALNQPHDNKGFIPK